MARPFSTCTLALAAGLACATPACATTPGTPTANAPGIAVSGDSTVLVIELTPKQGKLPELLQAEIAKADSLGRTPFIEIGATWCGQCLELKANIGDKRMIEAFEGTYIIRLDFDEWKEALTELGYKISAIPVFFAVGGDGKAAGTSFTTDPLGPNTPENVAAPLKKFFSENLKKKS